MQKTLLLVFIHGFKGGDDTFAGFPSDLATTLGHKLSAINVRAITYPKFETRGDLKACVAQFRDWLTTQVIDIEVAHGTQSPTIEPSVHIVLVGHSMGGIVAAEALLAIVDEGDDDNGSAFASSSGTGHSAGIMWPNIAGVLAFDTPYLGIAPSVVAHGAEAHYKTAAGAYAALTGALGYGAATTRGGTSSTPPSAESAANALAATESATNPDAAKEESSSVAKTWSRYAMFASAAGAAVAAGGAATAYFQRDRISQGWGWTTSHLEFVGCLARGAELKERVDRVIALTQSHEIGFRDIVTLLGKGASPSSPAAGVLSGTSRTFCSMPVSTRVTPFFETARNDRAIDETDAHMSMFERRKNPGYYALLERAKGVLAGWVEVRSWYRREAGYDDSSPPPKQDTEKKSADDDDDINEDEEKREKDGVYEEEDVTSRSHALLDTDTNTHTSMRNDNDQQYRGHTQDVDVGEMPNAWAHD